MCSSVALAFCIMSVPYSLAVKLDVGMKSLRMALHAAARQRTLCCAGRR